MTDANDRWGELSLARAKDQVEWALKQWRSKMTDKELVEAIFSAPAMMDLTSGSPVLPAAGSDVVAVLLREVLDRGLIYWEPQTVRGHTAKADMIRRCEAALASASGAPAQGVVDLVPGLERAAEIADGDSVTEPFYGLEIVAAIRAEAARLREAIELCKKDGKPCHASAGTDDARWRCGTVQCGTTPPAAAAGSEGQS